MPLVEAHSLRKQYDGEGVTVHALKGVDLAVEAGELVALMGPSGCGKSTLLHLLGGLDTPTAGEVLIDGASLAAMSDRERTLVRRTRIGFVFQFFNLVPVLTARENVELPGVIDGMPPAERDARVDDLLELVGVADRADHVPARLSGGEQQRVALARALVHRPPLLLADEPTGNLDRASGNEVMDLICHTNRALRQTVVLVTHDPAIAERADRVLHLEDGRITA
nr:3a01205: pleiotropic drug resistance family [uncultured bacterium]